MIPSEYTCVTKSMGWSTSRSLCLVISNRLLPVSRTPSLGVMMEPGELWNDRDMVRIQGSIDQRASEPSLAAAKVHTSLLANASPYDPRRVWHNVLAKGFLRSTRLACRHDDCSSAEAEQVDRKLTSTTSGILVILLVRKHVRIENAAINVVDHLPGKLSV
jgi:hypothetical protein